MSEKFYNNYLKCDENKRKKQNFKTKWFSFVCINNNNNY